MSWQTKVNLAYFNEHIFFINTISSVHIKNDFIWQKIQARLIFSFYNKRSLLCSRQPLSTCVIPPSEPLARSLGPIRMQFAPPSIIRFFHGTCVPRMQSNYLLNAIGCFASKYLTVATCILLQCMYALRRCGALSPPRRAGPHRLLNHQFMFS